MNIIITVLIIIIAIIAVLLIAALFIKKEYTIQQEIIINKTSHVVFDYIKHLKNQANYSKWVMMDPYAKKDYIGTDGTEGFISAWDSTNKNIGKGEQQIKKIIEGDLIDCEIRFERPFKNVAKVFMETTAISDRHTNVQWGMTGKNPYPFNLMNLFIPDMLSKDLDVSLTTLKKALENN
jgi:hypothetical protein